MSCILIRTLVAMATYSSHRLIMGKVEIDSLNRTKMSGVREAAYTTLVWPQLE